MNKLKPKMVETLYPGDGKENNDVNSEYIKILDIVYTLLYIFVKI